MSIEGSEGTKETFSNGFLHESTLKGQTESEFDRKYIQQNPTSRIFHLVWPQLFRLATFREILRGQVRMIVNLRGCAIFQKHFSACSFKRFLTFFCVFFTSFFSRFDVVSSTNSECFQFLIDVKQRCNIARFPPPHYWIQRVSQKCSFSFNLRFFFLLLLHILLFCVLFLSCNIFSSHSHRFQQQVGEGRSDG